MIIRYHTLIVIILIVLIFPHIVSGQEPPPVNNELFTAAQEGDLVRVDSLLEQGADANWINEHGTSCLMIASLRGNLNIVKLLVEHDADVNYRTASGGNALNYASSLKGNAGVIEYLIMKGAEVNPGTSFRSSPVIKAVHWDHSDNLKVLIEHGADIKNILRSVLVSSEKTAKLLVEAGVDLNIRNGKGQTPLIETVKTGMLNHPIMTREIVQVVTVFLENGAEVNAKDNNGRTALLEAVQNRHAGLVRLLIEYGADMSVVDSHMLNEILNPVKIPEEFIGWWMNKVLYEDLMNMVSPAKANPGIRPMLLITGDYKAMVTNRAEGWYQHLKTVNDTVLHINEAYGEQKKVDFSVTLVKTDSAKEIVFNDHGKEIRMIPYPEKYRGQPPDQMINDLYFAGTYTMPDSSDAEVTFSVDGKISGYRDMEKYRLGWGVHTREFDFITLIRDNRVKESYHWKVKGDTLSLYDHKINNPDADPIGTLHLKLVRKR